MRVLAWSVAIASLGVLLLGAPSGGVSCASQAPSESDLRLANLVKVRDGDSIVVRWLRRDGKPRRKPIQIRLAGIDCPEWTQPFGRSARSRTARLLGAGRKLELRPVATDDYGRVVAEVFLSDGRSLGEELVRKGFAWHDHRFGGDERLAAIQEEARRAGRGLWAQATPTPPWVYRRARSGA